MSFAEDFLKHIINVLGMRTRPAFTSSRTSSNLHFFVLEGLAMLTPSIALRIFLDGEVWICLLC